MEYASCAVNGGELIHASVANHDYFKTLITRCPCCKEPVMWRQAHTRQLSNGQLINVASAFIHRKSTDPLVLEVCELRVKNFTEQDIKRYASEARQQRWGILHQHFWNILLTSKAFNHSVISELAEQARQEAIPDNKFYELIETSYSNFFEKLQDLELRYKVLYSAHSQVYEQLQDKYNRENYIPSVVDETALRLEELEDMTFDTEEALDEYQIYFSEWDIQYQIATTKEIFDFLCSNQSRELFREVIYFIMIMIFVKDERFIELDNNPERGWFNVHLNLQHFAMLKLAEALLMINWRFQFFQAFKLLDS